MILNSPEGTRDLEFFADVATLPTALAKRAALTPDTPAFYAETADGRWTAITWSTYRNLAGALSKQFASRGLGPGKRLGLLGRTSFAWETAQMAALACGATVVGIDPYYPDALIDEVLADLALDALIIQDAATLRRLPAARWQGLRLVAFLEGHQDASDSFPTLKELARPEQPCALPMHAQPDAPAIITFSSGSTGKPKPIVYTHAQVVYACRCLIGLYPEVSPDARLVCWLPLANLFQRVMNFCAVAKGAASYIVEDPRRVMQALPIANPEIFAAVPRFCEKLHAGIMQRLAAHPLRARIVEQAIALGLALREAQKAQRTLPPLKRMAAELADRLVLARLRGLMGKRLKFIITGSAPMPPWLLERFEAIGIPVLEAYGVSENIVPLAASTLTARKAGTVGKPVGDNEVRISSEGEVQVRGRGVFHSTLAENRARAHALTPDGFLATGDLGALDEQGYLVLHGRAGEVFKNAQGRWMALPYIESFLRRVPGVEHAAVISMSGSRLIAVVTMEADRASKADARLQLYAQLRGQLTELPRAMRPCGFLIVSSGFSSAGGELTSNMKLRRAIIANKYRGALVEAVAECDPEKDEPPLKLI